jgi:hypothetical protein
MVVTGVIVDVVAALLFRVPISLPGIGRFAVLTDAASEVRLSWWWISKPVPWGACVGKLMVLV